MGHRLDYWRADSMWAAAGHPDGNLGQESITLEIGQRKAFITDWKYEKTRNNGTTFYGSHGRRLKNSSTQPIDIKLTDLASLISTYGKLVPGVFGLLPDVPNALRLQPGQAIDIKADIQEVSVPRVTPSGF